MPPRAKNGVTEAHGRGVALQVNFLIDHGAFVAGPRLAAMPEIDLTLQLNLALRLLLSAVLGAVIGWIDLRTRIPGRRALDYAALIPLGLPGIVVAVALIQFWLAMPIALYGTLAILLLAYVGRYIPLGVRAANASLRQVDNSLEESAQILGAKWTTTMREISSSGDLTRAIPAGGTWDDEDARVLATTFAALDDDGVRAPGCNLDRVLRSTDRGHDDDAVVLELGYQLRLRRQREGGHLHAVLDQQVGGAGGRLDAERHHQRPRQISPFNACRFACIGLHAISVQQHLGHPSPPL